MKKVFFVSFAIIVLFCTSVIILRFTCWKLYAPISWNIELFFAQLRSGSWTKITRPPTSLDRMIAHAGGGINGLTYTNSLESLEENYKRGFRTFEMDARISSDQKLVMIHGWGSLPKYFNTAKRVLSAAEFKSLHEIHGLSQLSIEDVASWMRSKPDTYLLLDVENIDCLKIYKTLVPDLQDRTFVQIYHFREYFAVKKLGFSKIILTLYRSFYADDMVVRFAKYFPIVAVATQGNPPEDYLPSKLKSIGVPAYIFTVNDTNKLLWSIKSGAYGVYTDFLDPTINF